MTLFTSTFTTDHSIDRWTITDDGKRYEIAYAHDIDAESPFTWGWEGIYILSHDRRRMDAGDESIRHRMDEWLDEKDLLEDMLENPHDYVDADLEGIDAETFEAHDEARPNVLIFDYLGFTVFVDCDDLNVADLDGTDEGIKTAAKDMVDTYNTWAEGNVYIGAIVPLDEFEDPHYVGGIYLDDAASEREQMEDIMRINLL